jgi:hypothetical protein
MIDRAPRPACPFTYDEAWLYCLTLDHKGYKDWRLPTKHEYSQAPDIPVASWFEDEEVFFASNVCPVTPVRDV